MKNVLNKLNLIQVELKAPKGQFNGFGKYKYRSCEDILESVKPLLEKYKCVIQITDAIIQVGERFYIEATVSFYDCESGEFITSKAYAREEDSKKGMDESQVTGSSSSYARKYALNGLLCIDDNKDSDTTNDGGSGTKGKTDKKTDVPVSEIKAVIAEVIDSAREKSAKDDGAKAKVSELLKEFDPSGNPNKIKDVAKAKELLEKIKTV